MLFASASSRLVHVLRWARTTCRSARLNACSIAHSNVLALLPCEIRTTFSCFCRTRPSVGSRIAAARLHERASRFIFARYGLDSRHLAFRVTCSTLCSAALMASHHVCGVSRLPPRRRASIEHSVEQYLILFLLGKNTPLHIGHDLSRAFAACSCRLRRATARCDFSSSSRLFFHFFHFGVLRYALALA